MKKQTCAVHNKNQFLPSVHLLTCLWNSPLWLMAIASHLHSLCFWWCCEGDGACCYNLRQHLFIDSSLSFETVSSAAELWRKSPEYSAGQISWVNRRSAPINISLCTCIQSLSTSIHCWIQFIQRHHLNYVRKWHEWMNKSLHTLPSGSHLSREPGIQLTKLHRPHSLLQSGSSHSRHGRTHRE